MKRLILICAIFLVTGMTLNVYGQISTLWERNSRTGAADVKPTWFGVSTERGIAYGLVGGNHRLYVPSRNGGTFIYILDAETGSNIQTGDPLQNKVLNASIISGGTNPINDAEVSDDGIIFVCNLTTSASSAAFKVYMWSGEDAIPTLAISYSGADVRLGDKFTVTGSFSDNTAIIWAASATGGAGNTNIYKFTMSGGTFSAVPEIIPLSDNLTGGNPTLGPLSDGSFYFNSAGINPKKYSSSGTLLGMVSGSTIATGSTSIKFLKTVGNDDYFVTYSYGTGTNDEKGNLVKVIGKTPINNATNEVIYGRTQQQGSVSSGGNSDVDLRDNGDGTFTIYVLGTNLGIGAYETTTGSIGWANLESPATADITTLGSVDVFAQVWVDGVTNASGQGSGISAWIGYNSENTNPNTWTHWMPATYVTDVGNNDQYKASLSGLPEGTYYYASRFQNQLGTYYYGGYDEGGGGAWDGVTNVSGVLTVSVPSTTIGWCNLNNPSSGTITTVDDFDVYGQIWIDGVTNPAGQAEGVSCWIGYSTENTNPNTWTNWVAASYVADQDNNDVYKGTLSGLAAGSYYYATRFQRNAGDYYYGGFSMGGGGFWQVSVNVSGELTVDSPPTDITWCNLQFPATANVQTFNSTDVYAQIYIDGVTNFPGQGEGITCWIGYSTESTNPNTWTNWILATYNTDADNNDEYKGVIPQMAKGTYYYASRFQRNGGDYAYGGYSTDGGGIWNGTTNISGVLTVNGMTGTYYVGNAGTRPGGGNPDFLSLKSACDAVNTTTVDGNILFYFTSNLTEPVNVALGKDPGEFFITFKPYENITPVIEFTQNAENGGKSGAWVFGVNSLDVTWAAINMKNIIVDGSNTADGITKDLTIKTNAAASATLFDAPIRFVGNVENCVIKNSIIEAKDSYSSIWITADGTNIADNTQIDNCSVTNLDASGRAIYIEGTSTAISTGTIINNCNINGKYTGIRQKYSACTISNNFVYSNTYSIYFETSCENQNIFNNEIKIDGKTNTADCMGIYAASVSNGKIVNIYNNKFSQIATSHSAAADWGAEGIRVVSNGTYNIYNNMFYGFSYTGSGVNCNFFGIYVRSRSGLYGSTANIYNNTFSMQDVGTLSGDIRYRAIWLRSDWASALYNVKNNLIRSYSGEKSYAIYVSDFSGGTFNFDYNNYYSTEANFITGFWNPTDQITLANWKAASGKDVNSISKVFSVVSGTDLHLLSTSIGDFDLAGTPLESVTTDIDGQTRSTTYPYMGADENLNVPLTPYKRNINGDFTDWTGTPSGTAHATVVSNQEAIYKGEGGDARTDQHGAVDDNWKNNDITDFRFTRDNSFIYFGIKMNDITDINRPYIAITIDKDQIDDTPLWIGANSGVSLAPGNNRGWERQIALHAISNGVLGIQLFADDGASWYNPLSNYSISGSADNDVIEAKIALYDLGLTPGSTLRLSVASFNNNLAPFAEEVYSYIDIVTPGYSGTSNAWFRGGENTSTLNANVQWDQSITPLPVELAGFTALPSGQKIDLKWSTKTEVNSYKFVVERSLKTEDGSQNALWEAVGEVNASGNSNSPKEYSFSDKNLADGKYSYRLKMIDNDGTFEYSPVVEVEVEVPNTFALSQNYPNPFNPVTQIRYQLPVNSQVKLMIFSITGELVTTLVDENQPAGNYTVPFDASALASGTYIYRLVAGDFVSTKKMVVLK
jgi:hypothetical protein